MTDLRRRFGEIGHRPDTETWSALEDLVRHLEAVASGEADPKFYLSPLFCGAGKTTAITTFVGNLLGLSEYRDVGVVMFAPRLKEIEAIIREAAIPREMLAVLTHDPAINALGGCDVDSAQVLITTHARLMMECDGRPFADIERLYFNGRPRQVRIYDESLVPGRALTLTQYEITPLIYPLSREAPQVAAALGNLFNTTQHLQDGERFTVPDFATETGITLNDALGILDRQGDLSDRNRDIAVTMWLLSGSVVTVRRENGDQAPTVLDYHEFLPADLAPLVICDASGGFRYTYDAWEAGRGNLVRLKSATKSYAPLKVHVWQRSGGKDAFDKSSRELVEGIVTTAKGILRDDPAARVLMVHHKPRPRRFDLEADVRGLLTPEEALRVRFVTWGKHEATNDFADFDNVMLCGTLFFPGSFYEALGRASAGLPSSQGVYPVDERRKMVIGEHQHLVFQAACRGRVRKSDGASCRPMNLYVIASTKSGIPATMGKLFPGCAVTPWRPLMKALTGKVLVATNELSDRLSFDDFVPFKTLQDALGLDKGNFRRLIRNHPDFRGWCREQSILEAPKDGGGRHPNGFRLDPGGYFSDETYDDDHN